MPTMTPKQVTALYKQALALQSKGQSEQALGIYSQILNSKNDIAEVHFQVGRIFFAGNHFEKSVFHLNIAASIKPNEAAVWNEYIPSLLCNIDPIAIKKAAILLKKSSLNNQDKIRLQNRLLNNSNGSIVSIGTLNKLSLDQIQQAIVSRDFVLANTLAKTFYNKNQTHPISAELLARTHFNLEQYAQARKYFKLAITMSPTFFDAHNNLGQLEMIEENYPEAIDQFKQALIIAPHAVSCIYNLADALARLGQASIGVKILTHAKSLHLKGGKIDFLLGELHARAGKYDISQKHFKTAIKKEKYPAVLLSKIGDIYNNMEQLKFALRYYQQSQKHDPSNHNIYYRIATALRQIGEFDDALENIQAALKIAPKNAGYLSFYTSTKNVEASDPIIDQMIELLNAPETTVQDRTDLGFGITKALEDSKQHNRVFQYLKRANDNMHIQYPYDINEFISEIDTVTEYFKDFDLNKYKGMGDPNAQPIFVCGMPRSGTTLVEQIISSHSEVIGAGEVGITSVIEKEVLERKDKSLMTLADVGDPELRMLGEKIWRHLTHHFPGGSYISDKSIQTYKRMGILKAAMPNCKIIVVRRDPRDNLLSIYRNKFRDGTHLYAYDLPDLGAYYNQFVRIVDFWRQKIPNQFMEIQYEDLINAPEKNARALIDFCNLDWQDDCLNFHKSKRQVKTLSVLQVRQPIYKSSVKAWQRYEDQLQPLFDTLKKDGNYPTDD